MDWVRATADNDPFAVSSSKAVLVHDPEFPSLPESSHAVAVETVGLVIAWYRERILAERRSSASDPRRLERLITEYRECVRDRERLEEAAPEDVARVTALYAARLKELEAGGE